MKQKTHRILLAMIAFVGFSLSEAHADMLVWDIPTEIATAETAGAATEGAAAATADAGINAEGHALTAATDEAGFLEQAMDFVKQTEQWVEQKVAWVKEETLLGQQLTEAQALVDKGQEQLEKISGFRTEGQGVADKLAADKAADHLPDDYTTGLQNAADAMNDPVKQAALSGIGEGGTATLFDTVTGRIGQAFGIGGSDEKLKLDNAAAAYNRTLSELIYRQAGQRGATLKGYGTDANGANNLMSSSVLTARIQAAQADIANEQIKIEAIAVIQKAQEQVAQQMAKQQRLSILGVNTGTDASGTLTSFVSQAATAATVWNVNM